MSAMPRPDRRRTGTILLVGSNANETDDAQDALRRAGVANGIVVLGDGREARDYLFCLGRFAGRPDEDSPVLVLLTLDLPGINGIDLVRRLRADELTQRIPVIVLTRGAAEASRVEEWGLSRLSSVPLPIHFAAFADAVRRLGLHWLLADDAVA